MKEKQRLIDGNKAKAVLVNMAEHLQEAGNHEMAGAVGYAAEVIGKQHIVDAVEVVHGRWEWLGPNGLVPECMCGTCSVCKVRSKYIVNTDICPNCGAKMDGDGDVAN